MFLPPCYIESRATNSCCTLVSGEQCKAPTAKCPASVFLAVEWRKETTRKLYSASLRTLSFGKQSHAFHIGSWAWRGRTGAYKKRWGLTSEFPWPIMERLWDQPLEHQRDTTELDIVEPTFLFTSREVGMGKFIFLNYTNMHFFFHQTVLTKNESSTGQCLSYILEIIELILYDSFSFCLFPAWRSKVMGCYRLVHGHTAVSVSCGDWRRNKMPEPRVYTAVHLSVRSFLSALTLQEKASPVSGLWDGPPRLTLCWQLHTKPSLHPSTPCACHAS